LFSIDGQELIFPNSEAWTSDTYRFGAHNCKKHKLSKPWGHEFRVFNMVVKSQLTSQLGILLASAGRYSKLWQKA
jgi:hypothetical protein